VLMLVDAPLLQPFPPAPTIKWVDYAIGEGILSGIGLGQPGKKELG
jgi:hypothetical protein